MKLVNKTILITGGTSGIGLALGEELLKRGNKVILLGRDIDKLNEAQSKGFKTLQGDLAKEEDIERVALSVQNDYPELDVLFNNAGVQFNYRLTEVAIPLKKICMEIDTNLTGQIMLTQLLIPVLMNSDRAMIVNTTSGLGAFPKSDGLVYSASKAGLRNFTVGLRYALKGRKIAIVEFIPPVVATNMTKGREQPMMTTTDLIKTVLPQLEKGRSIIAPLKMRIFLWIAMLLPGLADRIVSK